MFTDRFSRSIRIAMLLSTFLIAAPSVAESSNDDQSNQGSQDGQNGSSSSGDPQVRQEHWEYVRIPRFGIASLQRVLEVGSSANLAFLDVGEPIENYQPVALHAPIASVNNGAAVVYMLPERCLGDYNNNGYIDLEDVATFAYAYFSGDIAADLSGDGQIDVRDQILFLHLATIPCYSAW